MNPQQQTAMTVKRPPTTSERNKSNPKITMPTLVEIKQQELHQEICKIFRDVEASTPDASWHQRATQVAAKTGLSPEGVKKILEKNGISNPNKRTNNESK